MGVNGIYGLSGSGLDIESMVKVGMMSRQSQYDKMQQQYTKNEWKKAEYLNIYNTMQTFNTSTISQYKMSNNMDAHTAKSSDSSIEVTANSSAPIMRHSVYVEANATNAYLIGTNSLERIGKDSSSTSTQLKDVLFSNLEKDTATQAKLGDVSVSKDDVAFSFSVGDGVNGGITSTNPKVATAMAGSSATSGEHEVNITQMASNVVLSGSLYRANGTTSSSSLQDLLYSSFTQNEDGTISYISAPLNGNSSAGTASGTITDTSSTAFQFSISDGSSSASITFSYADIAGGATIDDVVKKINDSALNIQASYDTNSDKLSLSTTLAGSDNQITLGIIAPMAVSDTANMNRAGTVTARFFSNLDFTQTVNGITTDVDQAFSSSTSEATNKLTVTGQNTLGTIDGVDKDFGTNNKYTDSATGITYTAAGVGESTVTVNAEAIEKNTISVTYGQLLDGYTFNDLASAVNNLGQNARMTYDSVNDKFSLYNKNTGESNTVALAMTNDAAGAKAAEFFTNLGLQQSTNGELSDSAVTFRQGEVSVVSGSNASVKIDGVSYNLNENKTTVNGVTYDFTKATAGSTTATISVEQDKDKIIDYVKGFVKDYNELLSTLQKAYDEKPNTNYKPLTDSQKDQMTKEQVEKWEEKAKAGMLYHDQTLGKVIDELRSAVSTKIDGVSGQYNSIFSIGISTTGIKGQLTLDEDKLKAALTEDSEAVYNVFAKLEYKNEATSATGKALEAADNFSKSGIAQRISDVLNTSVKTVKSVSGSSSSITEDSDLNNLLRELQTKMSNFKAMMNAFEEKLYKKYDAMETMLAGLGVQLNYVTSAFA